MSSIYHYSSAVHFSEAVSGTCEFPETAHVRLGRQGRNGSRLVKTLDLVCQSVRDVVDAAQYGPHGVLFLRAPRPGLGGRCLLGRHVQQAPQSMQLERERGFLASGRPDWEKPTTDQEGVL